jgi:hypothetical protein
MENVVVDFGIGVNVCYGNCLAYVNSELFGSFI